MERRSCSTKRTEQFCKQHLSLVLGLYLVAQPLLDLLAALGMRAGAAVTASAVVRVAFLAFALAGILTAPKGSEKRRSLWALAAAAVYCAAFFAVMYAAGGFENCRANLQDCGKMLYVPITAIFFYLACRVYGSRLPDWSVAAAGALYALVILLAVLTGTSEYSYRTGFGFKGWFYAANEVSCILAIAGPVTVYYALERLKAKKGRSIPALLLIALALVSVAFSASWLGTKIVFAVLALFGVLVFLWCLVRALRTKRGGAAAAGAGFFAALTLALFLISPLGDYLDNVYLARMGMSSEEIAAAWHSAPTDAAEGVEVGVNATAAAAAEASEGTWLRTLISENPAVQKLDSILSRRLLNAAPAVEEYRNGTLAQKLFGIGYASAPAYGRRIDFMIELDGLNLLIRHGIVGFALFFLPYVALALWLIVGFFRRWRAVLGSLRRCTFLYAALCAFAISLLAGHVLTAPAVGIFMLAVTAGALADASPVSS